MKKIKTQRGFALYEFKDRNDTVCTVQKSSLETEDAIWLGAKTLEVQHFKAGKGWNKLEFNNTVCEHWVGNERMHLTKKQVKALLPILQKFVETGEI
jgi:hypothetical protein